MNNLLTQNKIGYWQCIRELIIMYLRCASFLVVIFYVLSLQVASKTFPVETMLSSCATETSREFGGSCDKELMKHYRKTRSAAYKSFIQNDGTIHEPWNKIRLKEPRLSDIPFWVSGILSGV